jgi:hypothetical protein
MLHIECINELTKLKFNQNIEEKKADLQSEFNSDSRDN